MTDTKANGGVNLTENIFTATLAFTLEFAIIYFVTTIMIFSGLYTNVWSIQAVGLLAIFHLFAMPIAYYGVKNDIRFLVLISLLLCCIWFILIIVYVVVFSVQKFDGNDFNYRSLHHIVLAIYSLLDLIVVVMLSIDIISEKSRKSLHESLNQSPTTPAVPPTSVTPSVASVPPVKSEDKLKKK